MFEYFSKYDILCADINLIYIITGIICAIVRQFHASDARGQKDSEYYYPARSVVSFFYVAIILQFPYILHPSDSATWDYIAMNGILYYPVCFATIYEKYFYSKSLFKRRSSLLFIVFPLLLIVQLLILSQCLPWWFIRHIELLYYVTGITSVLLTLHLLLVIYKLETEIKKFHYDHYSCEHDFPYTFAQKVLYIPLTWVVLMWLTFIFDSRIIKIFSDISISIWMVLLLLVIIRPPHKKNIGLSIATHTAGKGDFSPISSEHKEEIPIMVSHNELVAYDNPEGNSQSQDSLQCTFLAATTEEKEEIRQELAEIIKTSYKNSNLLKSDVIAEVNYGKKTLAKNYLAEVGFFNFVNAFRLEHARLYKEQNPQATADDVAARAGFRDRFALNYAKKKVSADSRALIGDFRPLNL